MEILGAYPLLDAQSPAEALAAGALFRRTLALEAQGNADTFRLIVRSASLGRVRLSAVTSTGHRIRLLDEENLALLLPWRGEIATDDGRTRCSSRGEAFLVPRPGLRATEVGPDYLGLVLQVPLAAWRGALRANPNDPPGGAIVERMEAVRGAGGALRRYLRHLVQEFNTADSPLAVRARLASQAEALLLDLMAEAVAPPLAEAQPLAEWQIARAEEYARAHLGEALRAADLALAAGIGTRALQMACRARRGRTPMQMLEALRLEVARDRLLAARPGETVTSIAMDCGLAHPGRFAMRFFARFGEAPGVTLRRGRLPGE